MAKGDYLSPYQKGIVRRYYDNKDTILVQKLTEAVSELYLCETKAKADRLWKTVRTALDHVYEGKARTKTICDSRDLKALAELVNQLF